MTTLFKNQVSFVDVNVMQAENESNNIGGTLIMMDLNTGKNVAFIAQHRVRVKYGTFTLALNGNWTYTTDQDLPAIKCLRKDSMYTDTFIAVSVDGREKMVMVTIFGVEDERATNMEFVVNPPRIKIEYGVVTLAVDKMPTHKKSLSVTTTLTNNADFHKLIKTNSLTDSIHYSKPVIENNRAWSNTGTHATL